MLKSAQYLAVRSRLCSALNALRRDGDVLVMAEPGVSRCLDDGDGDDDAHDALSDSFFDVTLLLFWSRAASAAVVSVWP